MVKIRLSRHGAKKAPFYRIVVADERKARDGRCIEEIGRYNPRTEPVMVEIDLDRYDAWIAQGAQATETVQRLAKNARASQAAE
ncbi:MAG: 30S ribosomal protein S16 [Coriobacteriales bacterium]|nr:30S ribosomal protein S16 [Coriobacteriales bacterium]